MTGLVPTRLVQYIMRDGSVRPFLIVFVHPVVEGDEDGGIVNGILFRDGLNDLQAAGVHVEVHKSPLVEWLPRVGYGTMPGTWKFTQMQPPAPLPMEELFKRMTGQWEPDFISKVSERVQQLLNDHTESIKRMLADAGAGPQAAAGDGTPPVREPVPPVVVPEDTGDGTAPVREPEPGVIDPGDGPGTLTTGIPGASNKAQ